MNHVYFYGSQEFETSSYFSWMAGGKSLTEMAEIIFSFLQFLCLILILLAKLSSKNIKKKMEKFSSLILIDQFFFYRFLALMLSTNETEVEVELYFTLPTSVKTRDTVVYSLQLTNSFSYNPYKQWIAMASPAEPSESQLKILMESSNIEQSLVEPFTSHKERLKLLSYLLSQENKVYIGNSLVGGILKNIELY